MPLRPAAPPGIIPSQAFSGSVSDTWNAGEADVVTIGGAGELYKVHSLLVSIHNLVGTVITVRLYQEVNGVERLAYMQDFDATFDPAGLWIINGTIGIHDLLRVTLESNDALDDNEEVHYHYMLEEAD